MIDGQTRDLFRPFNHLPGSLSPHSPALLASNQLKSASELDVDNAIRVNFHLLICLALPGPAGYALSGPAGFMVMLLQHD